MKNFRKALRGNRKLGLFLVIITLFAGYYFYVRSQNDDLPPHGVQISPYRFDWDLDCGQEKEGVINLKNYTDIAYNVAIEKADFYVSDNTTEAKFFIPDEQHPLKAYDVINWIEIADKITLAPGEGKDITFKIKVPEGIPTGGYYGALFFDTKPLEDAQAVEDGQARIMVNQKVGSLLVMAIKGDQAIERSGELKTFKASKKIFFEKPAELFAEVYNSGNLHYKVNGAFSIHKFGKRIVNNEMPALVIYPGKVREYPFKWEFSNWSYGYYKAAVDFISEDGEIQMRGETTFWVLPWKTTVSIIILLIIVYLILKFFNTKFEIRTRKNEAVIDRQMGNQNNPETFKQSQRNKRPLIPRVPTQPQAPQLDQDQPSQTPAQPPLHKRPTMTKRPNSGKQTKKDVPNKRPPRIV